MSYSAPKAQINAASLSPRWRAAAQLNKGNYPKPQRTYRRKPRPKFSRPKR